MSVVKSETDVYTCQLSHIMRIKNIDQDKFSFLTNESGLPVLLVHTKHSLSY